MTGKSLREGSSLILFELEHRAVVVDFLAEELAQFVSRQTVVDADGAGLSAAAAEVAWVAELDEPRTQAPVEFDIAVLKCRREAAVLGQDASMLRVRKRFAAHEGRAQRKDDVVARPHLPRQGVRVLLARQNGVQAGRGIRQPSA